MKKLYKFDSITGMFIGEVGAEIDEWQTKIAGYPCYKGIGHAVWEEPPVEDGKTAYMTENGWELRENKTLNELKQIKISELKFKRDSLEVEPFTYQGYNFDYDEKARDRISAAIIALDVSKSQIAWTTADNTEVMVTADDLRGVIANVAIRSNELHVKYRKLKEQVESCTTKEELDNIQWDESKESTEEQDTTSNDTSNTDEEV